MAAHVYAFNDDMVDDYFFNADGELLIVPQLGAIRVFTEMGIIDVEPSEICLIPRGMMFKVSRLGEGADGAAISARTTAPSSRCPIAARSAPIALPTRATSRRRSPPTRTRKRRAACM